MTHSKNPFRRLDWPLFLADVALLYYFFNLPPDQLPEALIEVNDKLLHFLNFLLLPLLAFRAFARSRSTVFHRLSQAKAVTFSLLYGALLEWTQLSVPGRSASFEDWLADFAGTLVASGIFWISRLTAPM